MASSIQKKEEKISLDSLGNEMKRYVDRLKRGRKDHYLIQEENQNKAVLMSYSKYQELINVIEDLKDSLKDRAHEQDITDRVQKKRNLEKAISLADLGKEYGFEK